MNGRKRRAAAGLRNNGRHHTPFAPASRARHDDALDRAPRIGQPWDHRHHQYVAMDARFSQCRQRTHPQFGPRRARLQHSRQPRIKRDAGKVDRDLRALIDAREDVDVAGDQGGLGGYRKMQARELREYLEHRTRQPVLPLGRLVRIGRGSDGDGIVADRRARERPSQHLGRHPLDEDAPLEVHRILQLQEVMGVAGVTVNASQLASAVGIDGPSEGHPGVGAPIEDLAHRHLMELDATMGFPRASSCESRSRARSRAALIGETPMVLVSLFLRYRLKSDKTEKGVTKIVSPQGIQLNLRASSPAMTG